MGYQTVVVILNDALGYVETDPNFGRRLAEAIRHLQSVPEGETVDFYASSTRGGSSSAGSAIVSHHADEFHLIKVGGNMAKDLGYVGFSRQDLSDEEVVRVAADKLGFRLFKKVKDGSTDTSEARERASSVSSA